MISQKSKSNLNLILIFLPLAPNDRVAVIVPPFSARSGHTDERSKIAIFVSVTKNGGMGTDTSYLPGNLLRVEEKSN